MKIFFAIIFNISILYANESLLIPVIPSASEIDKNLSPLKGGCEQCIDNKTSFFDKHYFDKFNCHISDNAEDSFKKAVLAAGLTKEKYAEMKVLEEDKNPSMKELEEIKSLLKSENGILTKCSLPKTLQSLRKNISGFKFCDCGKTNTGFVYCPRDKAPTIYLKDNEEMALELWTSSNYWNINGALRSKNKDSVCEMAPLVIEIMQGLAKTPSYVGTVYRGTGMPKDFEDQHQVGKIVEYSGLTSTALDEAIAKHFAGDQGWLLKINLKSACHDIQFLSQGESEILCPPGIRFKVIRKDESTKEMVLEEVVNK